MLIKPKTIRIFLAAATISLAVSLPVKSQPMPPPGMDSPERMLLTDLNELKPRLALSSQQDQLWQKAEAATRELIRDGQGKREQTFTELKQALLTGDFDPRALGRKADQEMAEGMKRAQDVRELWFACHDSLDAGQKAIVYQSLLEHLQRAEQMREQLHSIQPRMMNQSSSDRLPPGVALAAASHARMLLELTSQTHEH